MGRGHELDETNSVDRRTLLHRLVFSIGAVILYGPVLKANYVIGSGADARVSLGVLFEIILAISNIGTAVVLFPILKRQSESVSLGYVSSRVLESTIIMVGAISLLSVVTARQDFAKAAGADTILFVTVGKSLIAIHKWTFLIGPAFCAAFGNGILLGYLMYRSSLVPRPWAVLGLVAGCLLIASDIAVLLEAYEQTSTFSGLTTAPQFVWEGFLAIYLTFWGFSPSPILGDARSVA